MEMLMDSPVFIFLLVLALVALVGVLLINPEKAAQKKQAAKMHARIHHNGETTTKQNQEQQTLRRTEGDKSLPLMSRLIHRLPRHGAPLRARLAQSGSALTAERYMLYVGAIFCFTVMALFLSGKSFLIAILLGIIVGLGLPHLVVGFKINRRKRAFLILFPDAIELIVRGLKAGLPVTESIKMVAREISDPVQSVFQTMVDKMALGVPLERTLYDTAQKFRITEFDFFVTSIVLQRETGGNLSEILANLADTLRARLMMKMKIKAMSSEARASMYIIGALPFVVVGALAITSPDYLTPLFNDYRGNIALAIAGGMLGTGIFTMMQMAKFEI